MVKEAIGGICGTVGVKVPMLGRRLANVLVAVAGGVGVARCEPVEPAAEPVPVFPPLDEPPPPVVPPDGGVAGGGDETEKEII